MNKTLRIIITIPLIIGTAQAALISTTLTGAGSSTPYNGDQAYYGIGRTLDDAFAYNPNNPMATSPAQGDANGVVGFHGDDMGAHYLQYTFAAVTASGGNTVDFVVDLWGRNASTLNARDDNFTVSLYNGSFTTAIATSATVSIPDVANPYLRVSFDLANGVTFDRLSINAANTPYFTIAETRAAQVAAVPEPSFYGLTGAALFAGAAIVRRRRRR